MGLNKHSGTRKIKVLKETFPIELYADQGESAIYNVLKIWLCLGYYFPFLFYS